MAYIQTRTLSIIFTVRNIASGMVSTRNTSSRQRSRHHLVQRLKGVVSTRKTNLRAQMNPSITYLNNSTIVIFCDGKAAIIDEDLNGWNHFCARNSRVTFVTENRRFDFHICGSKYWYQRLSKEHHRPAKPSLCFQSNWELHRDGQPAVIWPNGARFWYQHGKLHRDGQPAVIYSDGVKKWYKYGKNIIPE